MLPVFARLLTLLAVLVFAGVAGIALGYETVYVVLVIVAVPLSAEIAVWILNRTFARIYKQKDDPAPEVATFSIGICVIIVGYFWFEEMAWKWRLPVLATGAYMSIRAAQIKALHSEIRRTIGYGVYDWFRKLLK